MVYCCVPHCTSQSSKNKGISFHEFPSSRDLTLLWLRNISRQAPDGSPWEPHKGGRSVVCGLHFDESDFKEGKKKKVLRTEAVPTIFPDHALDLRSKNDGRKRKSSFPAPPADTSSWKRLRITAADHEVPDEANTIAYGTSRQCITSLSSCLYGAVSSAEEACYSFGGGHVYPQETTKFASGHSLVWSKAQISKPAPNWEGTAVVNGEFKELKLADYKGKYLVFFFYPLDFTFVCPTEIIAFSDRLEEFRNINTEVVACSVDSHFTHLAWIKTARKEGGLGPIQIPLLSDLTHQIAKDYGVYLEDLGHTLRGLFIVDTKGVLRQITMNDLPVGRSVDETIRLVQAFQYTDSHGEVCPAGWKPGGQTIIPNPEEKLKYFKNINN